MTDIRVYILPTFEGPDNGDGGIRRVVEAQRKWLPSVGVEVVDSVDDANIVNVHAAVVARTDKPVVSSCHGLYWAEYEWPQWCEVANKHVIESMRRADAVTAVSEWVANAIARNTMIQAKVVYHGVDIDDWPAPPLNGGTTNSGSSYVLWNKTRPDPVCDPTPMQQLAKMCPDVKFVSTFGEATSNVTVTGKLDYGAARERVRGAAVYLCTTRETFGIGTLEALAAGVPVVGWDWGGQAEIITPEGDGILAWPGDYPALEKALRQCLAPENHTRMAKAAREKAARFQWKDMIAGYRDVYEEVLDRRRTEKKVSVIVRCHNLGQYVARAVESVQTQQMVDGVETIIVDDAGTDDSGAVCDSLATAGSDDSVRVIHNATNQYLAGALNVGIAAARGRYVLALDADDRLGDGALRVLCDALDADNAVDIVYGSMGVLEPDGKEWVSSWPGTFDFGAQMAHKNQIMYAAMYRKRIWERVGGYRRRCKTGEDADFWCRATSYGAVAKKVTDMVTLRYTIRENSVSHLVPDWPWEAWYPWAKDARKAPPISPTPGPIWTNEPVRISVVIPCGPGHEKVVIDAIDSLIANDFRLWEAIVINDSGVALEGLHPFVRVFDTRAGGGRGPAVSRNIGFENARGLLVLPLDADDYLQPNALAALWKRWQQVGGYVYSDWIVQETGEVKQAEDYDCNALLRHLPHAVTALYPRAAWKDVGGFDEHLDAWEDWDFVIALAAKGVCGSRLDEPLLQYRMNGGHRREELYARREELKQNIVKKWRKYFDKEATLMACGGCGGSKPQATPKDFNMMPSKIGAGPNGGGTQGELVLLEYVGRTPGPLTFRGQKTGVSYRFGSDAHHRRKFVHAADAEALLGRQDFRAGKPEAELLQAAGV